jgi:asparagine synthase (glutamine-hydrolysing)
MCGIVGFKTDRHFDSLRQDLDGAVSCLTHRGPDDSGLFFDREEGVGLGHRRLSILDLSDSGRQPMTSDDGEVHISYNGEIYNFKKLRVVLEGHGHHFSTGTDTEVALKAYCQWGIDCLNRFVGMFSFVVWDGHKRRLFLARDRLGIKPFYYHYRQGTLLFGSELKAIMAFSEFSKDIDLDNIPLFLHYQYIPAPRTIFKNTFKLLPGHYAVFDGRDLEIRPYWEIPESECRSSQANVGEEVVLEELDQLLTQAVSDRLVSDVPLGALLSGGVDSSMMVAMMQKVNTSPVRTFSIGFENPKYNEAPWASKVAEHLGTDHTELYVTAKEAMQVIPKLPGIYDEPFADSSAVPTFLVSSLARSHVTVALAGDGGDEQFCGYVRYWSTKEMYTRFQRLPPTARRFLAYAAGSIPHGCVERVYPFLSRFVPQRLQMANFTDKWQKLTAMMEADSLMDLYREAICLWPADGLPLLKQKALPTGLFEHNFRTGETWPLLSRLMRVDQMTYLPDALLTKVDRASMAVSLEVRVPLLDHRIVEFTSGLPDDLKCRNGIGKYILKKLLARYIPIELIERPKMGFGVPIDQWFRDGLKELLLDYLSPDRLRREALFDRALVEEKIKEHLSGKTNHQHRLWSLLMWEMWREHCIDS